MSVKRDPAHAARAVDGHGDLSGRLHIAYRYRHPQFDKEAVRRLAEGYEAALDLFIKKSGD